MIDVRLDDAELQVLITGALRRGANFRPVLADFGEYMVRSIQRNFEVGGRPEAWKSSRSEKTLVDNARLKNSINYQVARLGVRVGTNVRYARIHHYGGDIKPRIAKALAIPLQSFIRGGPRRYPDLVYLPPEEGKPESRGILARVRQVGRGRKAKSELQPMFALRARVRMPARPFMLFQEEDKAYAAEVLREYLLEAR